MIIRRRTYIKSTVVEKYGYYMINSTGNSTDYKSVVYADDSGNYYNPVYKRYGAEERTGSFPSSLMNTTRSVTSNNKTEYLILLMSYTDGTTIVCLNGNKVYQSTDGGANWATLFTLNYPYTLLANRILAGPFVYFDSTYIYILFETSDVATITYNSRAVLRLALYNRSSGTLTYRDITSYTDRYTSSLAGPGTRMSPNGFICVTFVYKKLNSLNSDYHEEEWYTASSIKAAMIYLPGLATSNNYYKEFEINISCPNRDLAYVWGRGSGSIIPKWNWDGTTYGCFLMATNISYYKSNNFDSNHVDHVCKISVGLNGSTVATPTVTLLYYLFEENLWNTEGRYLAEHSQAVANGETMYIKAEDVVKIMNVSDWTVKKSLQSLGDMTEAQGDRIYANYAVGVNVTPDGLYYVIFADHGYTVFIHRASGRFIKSIKFQGNGNTRNTYYCHYMMPRRVI